MQKVKVVIWDLDDTFWEGTLSEGEIRYSQRNHDLVLELADRGILSTISSKNDERPVRELLVARQLWDLFVFTRINWRPKGPQIAELLRDLKLRPHNALFIDDNPSNLAEARFYSPELQVASPEILPDLKDLPALRGRNDPRRSRLRHYKILEEKQREKERTDASNEDFLRQSGITVTFEAEPLTRIDRIAELVERTNQLNYTKARVGRAELERCLTDPSIEAGCLSVTDRYGDYGVCGFYALKSGALLHFLFSCRIIDMGVERWLYQRLGYPSLEIRGEVATPLPGAASPQPEIDWITVAEEADPPRTRTPARVAPRILLKGGCDLEQIKVLLGREHLFDSELNYVTAEGVPVHREHTEWLRRVEAHNDEMRPIISRIPFLDDRAFTTRFFDGVHDAYIYSPLMDFTQGLYRHRDTDLRIPYGDYRMDVTDTHHWPHLIGPDGPSGLSPEFLEWFAREFRFEGPISRERFRENLEWIRDRLRPPALLILLNGAEVPFDHPIEIDRWRRHQQMNEVLDEMAAASPALVVCDVRRFATNPADFRDSIRHYRRRVYPALAEEIRRIVTDHFDVRFSKAGDRLRVTRATVTEGLKSALRKILPRR